MDIITTEGKHSFIFMIFGLGMLVWTFGLLAGSMALLGRQARKDTLHEVPTLRAYGFLYLGYENQYWFWEGIKRGQSLMYNMVETMMPDIKMQLVMYCMISGLSAIGHVAFQPFDDRNNQMLDKLETVGLVAAFMTQCLFQMVITFPVTLQSLIGYFGLMFIFNCCCMVYMAYTFLQEYFTNMGKKELKEEEKKLREAAEEALEEEMIADPLDTKGSLQRLPSAAPGSPGGLASMSTMDLGKKEEKKTKVAWYSPKVIKKKIGEFVERSAAIQSRLTVMRTPEGNFITRLVARTPRNAKTARNYKYFDIKFPDDTPMCVTGDDRG